MNLDWHNEADPHAGRCLARIRPLGARIVLALCVGALAGFPVLSEAGASTATAPVTFGGGVVMKPLATKSCKGSVDAPRKLTYIECLDTGNYRLLGRDLGAAYRWRWTVTAGKPAVPEAGSFSLNFGNGNLFLTMKGTARPVGKVTRSAGTQKTTGTWRYYGGTGAYKNRSGSGTYTFDLERNATTYLVLALGLKGTIR